MSYVEDAAAELAKVRDVNGEMRRRAMELRADGQDALAAEVEAMVTETSLRLAEDYIALAALKRDAAPPPVASYGLYRGQDSAGSFGTLAEAMDASGIPASRWNAVPASHPDEICTFYSEPGVVPQDVSGPSWTVFAPGVAAEFIAAERAAGRLPSHGREA